MPWNPYSLLASLNSKTSIHILLRTTVHEGFITNATLLRYRHKPL